MTQLDNNSEEKNLTQILDQLLASEDRKSFNLKEIVKAISDKGFGLLLILISLPSALPIPASGYSTPLGIILAFLGAQLILNRKTPWVPAWCSKIKLKRTHIEKMIHFSNFIFKKLEFFIKPRLHFFNNSISTRVIGILIVILALIAALPIPLTNTAPSMIIFLIGLGISEDDGLFKLGAGTLGILLILVYFGAAYVFLRYGTDGLIAVKNAIKEFIQQF